MNVEIKERKKYQKRKKRNTDVDESIFNFICLKDWGHYIWSHLIIYFIVLPKLEFNN